MRGFGAFKKNENKKTSKSDFVIKLKPGVDDVIWFHASYITAITILQRKATGRFLECSS